MIYKRVKDDKEYLRILIRQRRYIMAEKMLNFTVGPVMSYDEVLEVSGESSPYFRTPEFSEIMKENERIMLKLMKAPSGSGCCFLTASGTGAMESVVMNVLRTSDKVIVVNGGTFGQRFADLCKLHKRECAEIKLSFGEPLKEDNLTPYENSGYTALLVNMCETSSGVLYDMNLIAEFCKRNNILLIVDAISAFLADELDMEKLGAAVVLTGSQKALALHPGISVVALSPKAQERVNNNDEACLYLSLKEALKNGERGQTPFTPAVSILLQLNTRLRMLEDNGGSKAERERIAHVAATFREGIKNLPLEYVTEARSNCVTALRTKGNQAKELIEILKKQYGIWICPNGGEIGESVFRVGHIGNITDEDNQKLVKALKEIVF